MKEEAKKKLEKLFMLLFISFIGVILFMGLSIIFGLLGFYFFAWLSEKFNQMYVIDVLLKSWVFASTGGYLAQRIWMKIFNHYKEKGLI